MEVRQARYFLAMVDQESMSRAAETLHMTQPALSQAIVQLERDMKAQLFQRTSRGMRLTEHAQALVGPARRLVEASMNALSAVQLSTQDVRGPLVIASTPAFASAPLSGWVAAFKKVYPAVTVYVVPFTGERTIERVLDRREADLVLAHYSADRSSSIIEVPMGREELVLVLPANEDPFIEGTVSLNELDGRPLIMGPPNTSMYRAVSEAFESVGIEPTVAVETQFMDTFLPLTAGGAGWSILPEAHLAASDPLVIHIHSLQPAPLRHYSFFHLDHGGKYAATLFLRLAQVRALD